MWIRWWMLKKRLNQVEKRWLWTSVIELDTIYLSPRLIHFPSLSPSFTQPPDSVITSIIIFPFCAQRSENLMNAFNTIFSVRASYGSIECLFCFYFGPHSRHCQWRFQIVKSFFLIHLFITLWFRTFRFVAFAFMLTVRLQFTAPAHNIILGSMNISWRKWLDFPSLYSQFCTRGGGTVFSELSLKWMFAIRPGMLYSSLHISNGRDGTSGWMEQFE